MSPFDAARYARLLEGLEVTEKKLSELERTLRMDAEFFQRRHLQLEERLGKQLLESVAEVANVSDGNHFSISESFVEEGIPYYRGQDVVGHFFIEQAAANAITREAFEQPFMRRSYLQRGDVLLSIIGTVGETSLVKTARQATCSCKLAILRPHRILPEYLGAYLSSPVGKALSERWKRGAVQTGLLLEDMDQIPVARFSEDFESAVKGAVDRSFVALEEGRELQREAEHSLVHALDLDAWTPSESLSYVRSSSQAIAAGRLDAEYQHPRHDALFSHMSRRFELKCLSALGEVTKGVTVKYFDDGVVPIIRSGDLRDIEFATNLRSRLDEPIFYLRKGDVLISSIGFGSIGKVQIFDREGDFGTVSEVTVIRQNVLNPYYVAAFFRSRAGQMQIERHITGATGQLHLYPRDVATFWVPVLPEPEQVRFEMFAKRVRALKSRAAQLLDAAKRAVEIAIEDSETAALAYLRSMTASEPKSDGFLSII